MSQFESIHIEGFRRLIDVKLPLRPMMVMIGANGCGKTSFLDIWQLLARACEGQLRQTLSDMGGFTDLLTKGRADTLSLRLSQTVEGHPPLEYQLQLGTHGAAYRIDRETLTQQNYPAPAAPMKYVDAEGIDIKYFDVEQRRLLRPTWEHDPFNTALSQVPKMFPQAEGLRRELASCVYYGPLDVSARSVVRLPQPLEPAELPGPNGERLISCLYSLRETDRDRYEMVEDSIRAVFPGFERLDFPPVAAGMLAMTWKDKNFSKGLYTHQLSEGSLRFLWLATLLQSRSLQTITLLDEPEVSLHPELLGMLVELMRQASRNTQLFVATHSDRLVGFLRPEEVVAVDIGDDGGSLFRWGDELDLAHWLKDFTLDELWAMGVLGGRAT